MTRPASALTHISVFSEPGHDHDHCTDKAMVRAERICAKSGVKLTSMRRNVLRALADTHQPIGAYDLIQRLEDEGGKRPAPITIYRALDFLVKHRLAHRIESRNAFVACGHDHSGEEVVMFLICEQCGAVGEAVSSTVAKALSTSTEAAGFAIRGQVIEIAGTCQHCR